MSESIEQPIPENIPVISAATDMQKEIGGIAAIPAWEVGEGYGNQMNSEYTMNPMTIEGAELPVVALEDSPEDVFVINVTKLESMNDAERNAYFLEKAGAMVSAAAIMRAQQNESEEKAVLDPMIKENIELAKGYQADIDRERAEMETRVGPMDAQSDAVKSKFHIGNISSALFQSAVEFAPQLLVAGALVAGAAGTAQEAHAGSHEWKRVVSESFDIGTKRAQREVDIQNRGNQRYEDVGAKNQAKQERLQDKYEDHVQRIEVKYDAKKGDFNQRHLKEFEAFLRTNPTPVQIKDKENATDIEFQILKQARTDEINAAANRFGLSSGQQQRAENRDLRAVNRGVRHERGDADSNATQDGIGALGKVLRYKIGG